MELKAFTVYDSASQAYLLPFFCKTSGEAIRMFTDSVADPSTAFSKHPADFTLFEIGGYDDATGIMVANHHQNNLGTALAYQTDRTVGNGLLGPQPIENLTELDIPNAV